MNLVRRMEEKYGGWWAGIVFHQELPIDNRLANRPMTFCEAIKESRKGLLILTPDSLDCPGGKRSFGWSENSSKLAQEMTQKAGVDIRIAEGVIENTPFLENKIKALTIGTYSSPDVVVSYSQPEDVMKVVRHCQQTIGLQLQAEISSFMAVCGNVAVRAYLSGEICLSFGCPDSRKHGTIGRDRLIIGMPFRLVEDLFHGESISIKSEA